MRVFKGKTIKGSLNPHVDLSRFLAFVVLAHESDLWVVRNFCDGDFSAGFDSKLPIYDLADDLDSDLGPISSVEGKAALSVIHEVLRLRALEGDERGKTSSSSFLQEKTVKNCVHPKKRFRFRVLTDFDDTAMPPHHKISGTELWAGKGDDKKAPQGYKSFFGFLL